MNIQKDSTVGQIATEYPPATRVFHRHRIDFCCGGDKRLEEVCANLDLTADTVIEQIREELDSTAEPVKRWDQAPLTEVIDHILATYHKALREELPRLDSMTEKVL